MARPKLAREHCPTCGSECARADQRFCTNRCQRDWEYYTAVVKWLTTGEAGGNDWGRAVSNYVKRFLIATRGEKCELCGWAGRNVVTGKVVLAVHHVDGDHKNGRRDNLQLLCPNCHSLTPNYGNLNFGKGRAGRREAYKKKAERQKAEQLAA